MCEPFVLQESLEREAGSYRSGGEGQFQTRGLSLLLSGENLLGNSEGVMLVVSLSGQTLGTRSNAEHAQPGFHFFFPATIKRDAVTVFIFFPFYRPG